MLTNADSSSTNPSALAAAPLTDTSTVTGAAPHHLLGVLDAA